MLAVRMSSVALACDTASMSVSRLGIAPSSDYPDHILETGTYTPWRSRDYCFFIGLLAPTDKDHKLAGFALKKLCVWCSYRPLSSS